MWEPETRDNPVSVESDLEWLWRAADSDHGRPALECLHITEEAAEATDGHRLHRLEPHSLAFRVGLVDREGKVFSGATYPDTSKVIIRDESRGRVQKIVDLFTLRTLAHMAEVGQHGSMGTVYLELDTPKGPGLISGRYVADALRVPAGRRREAWSVFTMGPHDPVQFRCEGLIAVVMPVRVSQPATHLIKLNIDRCLGAVKDALSSPVAAEAALD